MRRGPSSCFLFLCLVWPTTVAAGDSDSSPSSNHPGFGTLIAVGYELYQGASFGLDLQARHAGIYGDASSDGNLVIGAGLSWYP